MIKAVIFDYDETLVKTLESRIPAYIDLAKKEYTLNLTPEKIRQALGLPYEEFIHILFGNVDSVESIIKKYQSIIDQYPMLAHEESVATVKLLVEKYLVGVVSGVRRQALTLDMKRLDFPIKDFFYLQCGEDTTIHKPDPRVFDPLKIKLKSGGIKSKEVVYIGDNLDDFAAAKGAGFHFIALAGHTNPASKFIEAGAIFVTKFSELPAKILEISQ